MPGVAINRQVDPNSDSANPVLGERSGNNNFLIDGQPNKDTVNGGPAQQFNQETIAEFQVLTNGYKAEFGQASGAIVNVITKSGGNTYRGVGSLFFRDDALDSTEFAGRDENGSAAAPPLRLQPGGRRAAGQGQGLLLRLGGADQRKPPAGFQVSGYRQRGRQPAAPRPGGAVRRADQAVRDARVRQVRSARRPAPVDRADQLHRQQRHQLPAVVVGLEPALGAKRYRRQPAARGLRRHGVARRSRQPVRLDVARRLPQRRQQHGPFTDHADRGDALQSL